MCEKHDIELGRKVHAFDLKSNEWHIAAVQIYENLFRDETSKNFAKGLITMDDEGNFLNSDLPTGGEE